jgi:hypothetical protein
MRFEQCTGRKIGPIESVVEFGGGYGNMARIVNNVGATTQYSIVDLLLFSCIQYVFLCTVAGSDHVTFDNGNVNASTKFLLKPLCQAVTPQKLHGKLFLSTWALSETTRATYKWVNDCDWFGAYNLILAYNRQWQPWQGNELDETLESGGWRVAKEAIPFLPGSFYLFATR